MFANLIMVLDTTYTHVFTLPASTYGNKYPPKKTNAPHTVLPEGIWSDMSISGVDGVEALPLGTVVLLIKYFIFILLKLFISLLFNVLISLSCSAMAPVILPSPIPDISASPYASSGRSCTSSVSQAVITSSGTPPYVTLFFMIYPLFWFGGRLNSKLTNKNIPISDVLTIGSGLKILSAQAYGNDYMIELRIAISKNDSSVFSGRVNPLFTFKSPYIPKVIKAIPAVTNATISGLMTGYADVFMTNTGTVIADIITSNQKQIDVHVCYLL